MDYNKDLKWVRRRLKTFDVLNTIDGGMSQPTIKLVKESEFFKLQVNVPGIKPEALSFEIKNDDIVIHHNLTFENGKGTIDLPHVITAMSMKGNVFSEGIYDYEEGNEYVVQLPFSDRFNKR